MGFQLKDFLAAIGPSTGLIFASWIFMGFLQQRYVSAFERYRILLKDVREDHITKDRMNNIKDQALVYKKRCELMKLSTNLGLIAAMFLIVTLMTGGLDVIYPHVALLQLLCTGATFIGLLLVIAAAVLVVWENNLVQRALDSEVLDIPELAEATQQRPGSINEH